MAGIHIRRHQCFVALVIVAAFFVFVAPASAQKTAGQSCKFLCQPTLLIEPTVTIENLASPARVAEGDHPPETELRSTVFEAIVALDIPTSVPRLSVTLEAIVHPFVRTGENPFTGRSSSDLGGRVRDNPVEVESEINFHWLQSEQTRGWISSHFDVVDQFSPAARPADRSVYTHKLDFELDTAFALFKKLPENSWFRDIELELSLDYLATGRPMSGDRFGDRLFIDGASPWSLSLVFVIPVIRGH